MTARGVAALAVVAAMSCADEALPARQAAVTLSRTPAEALASGASIAVAAALDDGEVREVALGAEAVVSLREHGATVSRASQPPSARPLTAGARVTLRVHTAITQLDAGGRAVGRIENPFSGGPGRARLAAGRSALLVLSDDPTDAAAWRVLEAYALTAAGDALAEPALGFAAGTVVDAVFSAR